MAPLSSTAASSGLAPMNELISSNVMNLPISITSSLNAKPISRNDGEASEVQPQLSVSEPPNNRCLSQSGGASLPAEDNAIAQRDEANRPSAPSKKLFLTRKRGMNHVVGASEETPVVDFKRTKLEVNATPLLRSSIFYVSSQTTASEQQPVSMNGSLTAGDVASALCAIKRQGLVETKRIVTPEIGSQQQQSSKPTIRPLLTDFCFGPGTSRNPGNKALKHIAYYTTLPFLQENARAVANENIIIAKKVVETWTSTGGRFLKSDDKSALWLPVQDDDFILGKIQRSIGSWKGAWRQELKE